MPLREEHRFYFPLFFFTLTVMNNWLTSNILFANHECVPLQGRKCHAWLVQCSERPSEGIWHLIAAVGITGTASRTMHKVSDEFRYDFPPNTLIPRVLGGSKPLLNKEGKRVDGRDPLQLRPICTQLTRFSFSPFFSSLSQIFECGFSRLIFSKLWGLVLSLRRRVHRTLKWTRWYLSSFLCFSSPFSDNDID